MKEMVYQKEFKKEVLYSGKYKAYKFAILSLGLHPTAYVENKNNFRDIEEADGRVVYVPHGGFTYCNGSHWDAKDTSKYLGWDYGHCDDFSGYYTPGDGLYETTKRWTTDEIYEEVKKVIDALVDLKGSQTKRICNLIADIDMAISEISDLMSDEQDRIDNLPLSQELEQSDYQMLNAIENLDGAIDQLRDAKGYLEEALV